MTSDHGIRPMLWRPNESVEKVLLASANKIFRGHLTLPKHGIVDSGAFCQVFFSTSNPRICLGAFSTDSTVWGSAASEASPLERRVRQSWDPPTGSPERKGHESGSVGPRRRLRISIEGVCRSRPL